MKNKLAPVFLSLALTGCSMRLMALRTTADLLETGVTAVYEETDVRYAREAMTSHLKLLEALLKNDPKNPKLLFSLTQGFGGYAFLFIEDENPERARYFYLKGRDYGRRLLAIKPEDAPALFWTAYCWAGWAALSLTNPDAIADLPKVEAMVRQAEQLNPGYFYSGADQLLGAYYASRPKMFGGDLAKSKSHFENAVKKTDGKFLMAQVLYAKYHAVAAQDRKHFESLLDGVITAPADVLPEQGLPNQVAREKAKRLLGKIDELF
ncbi:MAG: hypothetical protein A2901_08385 [Elusimicrobia bacterium RIFCSPLOWO2_01_FULL_54_10]|nr:MAG: hypothetical protein A2901_08385 [Elusimicrobia bacterium RIFCSPLOWO2_01_FULL_54_10]